ncbi:hypothetical protein CON15_19275 [Bacillus cereus]|uniref:Uncharacterized protein n=1 Tax=Bacillus thuringiensis TaxID=1428 RepID=A0AB36VFZ7_BACTU|nr:MULTISPECIES: hypothetical protein [Bacillus cereus group]PDZ55683.1 hypothetical protein CON15_19275 [Bacillus cereus]PES54459.1 hypothetical protein CN506_20500 [Bacillus thuringiensis]PFO26241.1 hypothetical protein COJ78_29500 [Bacillus thuringiensis]PFS40303.1 hypothetical protein COK48_00230 [Bacillus thuringiensis]PFS58240.1 hypothetical protein COK64_17825 [Bacillus thuringiensis]
MNEWNGNYQGGRKTCSDCINYNQQRKTCNLIQAKIHDVIDVVVEKANICANFQLKTHLQFRVTDKIDCADGIWRYEDYIEWLMNDFYRPYRLDRTKIVGSSKLGCVVADGGRLAELIPNTYSPLYGTLDCMRCKTLNYIRNILTVEGHSFHVNLLDFRDLTFVTGEGLMIHDKHTWRPTKRSKIVEEWHNRFDLKKLAEELKGELR